MTPKRSSASAISRAEFAASGAFVTGVFHGLSGENGRVRSCAPPVVCSGGSGALPVSSGVVAVPVTALPVTAVDPDAVP
jgi:hypothetical protein